MSWRKGHGQGAPQPVHVETLPVDELPKPIIKPELGRGGATKIKLARHLQIDAKDPTWIPYQKLADQFRKAQCRALAKQAGGRCGIAPSALIASAALQLAMSRWLTEQGIADGDPSVLKMASSMMNDSRQNLLAAFELATREARAMREFEKHSPHADLEAALSETISKPSAGASSSIPNKHSAPGHGRKADRAPNVIETSGEPVADVED